MIKNLTKLTLMSIFFTISFSGNVFAAKDLRGQKVKYLVKVKLWYEGINSKIEEVEVLPSEIEDSIEKIYFKAAKKDLYKSVQHIQDLRVNSF